MPIRRNIVTNATARRQYVDAAIALKNQFTGVTTRMLGIAGPDTPVSTWDRFVAWHHTAMGVAHRGPLFLPWHRLMLRTLEQLMAQAINDATFGLPYWDWSADGELSTQARRLAAPVWADNCMGRASSAPGRFTLSSFPVRLEANATGAFVQTRHALRRARGVGFTGFANPPLPRRADTAAAIAATPYDVPPWNVSSVSGFRSRVEGWSPANGMHNLVHIWVGGDMLPSSSPNDPVFYLNHCNEDRIWERWMQTNGRSYRPAATTAGAPVGQRINDPIPTPFGAPVTAAQLLNMTSEYTYESLAV
jgi:tyrosinase